MKTLTQLANDAMQVQDACNLCGVAQGFARALLDLHAALPDANTDTLNQHPIAVMWAYKIQRLTGDDFSAAYKWCKQNDPLTMKVKE